MGVLVSLVSPLQRKWVSLMLDVLIVEHITFVSSTSFSGKGIKDTKE